MEPKVSNFTIVTFAPDPDPEAGVHHYNAKLKHKIEKGWFGPQKFSKSWLGEGKIFLE